jgi:hypothetical protein
MRYRIIIIVIMMFINSMCWSDVPPPPPERTDDAVITNIAHWDHPVKKVFKQYQFEVVRVELRRNRTYPIFFMRGSGMPGAPELAHNDKVNRLYLNQVASANGWWPFSIQDEYNSIDVLIDQKRKEIIEWTWESL